MVCNLFGGCSWYALIVYPMDVHDVSQLIGPCTSLDNAYSCCDGTTVCGYGFHTVIYWNDFGSNARVQVARRAATPKFFGSSRVARAFRLAVEAAICFWLLHGVVLCVCLAWSVCYVVYRISYGVSNLKVSSVQHVDCDGGECNHNEVESYVVRWSHMTM